MKIKKSLKRSYCLAKKTFLGLSPIVSMIMIIAFSVMGMILVLTSINPTIEKAKESAIIAEAQQNLQLLNSIIKEVASEAEGSKRTIAISVADGVYYTNATTDYLYFQFAPTQELKISGIKGDIYLEKDIIFADYFNHYPENDNAATTWSRLNGTWKVTSGRYYGNGGIAYKNLGVLKNFTVSAKIYSQSEINGEVFIIPKSPRNLIAYWTFDEGSGDKIYDFSMNSHNGTRLDDNPINEDGNTPPLFVEGKFSTGMLFDGLDDYIEVYNNSVFDLGIKSFTITFWIKPKEQKSNEATIIGRGGYGQNGWVIRLFNSTKSIAFYYGSPDGWSGEFAPQVVLNFNEWTYVAVVVNITAGKGASYRNGVLVGEKVLPSYYSTESTLFLYIGKAITSTEYYNGAIDEIKIYDVGLNSDEIMQDYLVGLKKLKETGTVRIENNVNCTLVLSAPLASYFDDIRVSTEGKYLNLIIPYQYDIINSVRIPKGNHNVVVENKGYNSTSGKVMIEVGVE